MRRTTAVLVLVSVALLLLCAYLVYASLDQAVSLDHARAAQRSLEQDRAVLQKLTVDLVKGTRRADVKALLTAKYAAHPCERTLPSPRCRSSRRVGSSST